MPESRVELIEEAVCSKKILYAINAEKIINLSSDEKIIINNNIAFPDGIGAVWALKRNGLINACKIPGCELWLDLINRYHSSKSFYIIGGKQKVLDDTLKKIRIQFPGINILGSRNGYFRSNNDYVRLIESIKNKKPEIIFVAMGSPKQENLIKKLYEVNPATYMGLGGSFDVYTGDVKRAPKFFVRLNLEWAYRLFKEPKRIFRQFSLISFLFHLLLRKI